jgi:hypothetical protein
MELPEIVKNILKSEGLNIEILTKSRDLDDYIDKMIAEYLKEKWITENELAGHLWTNCEYKIDGLTNKMVRKYMKRPKFQTIPSWVDDIELL